MAAPEQHGQACEVGVGDYDYAGYIPQNANRKALAVVRKIKNKDGQTVTRIILDKGFELKLALIVAEGTDPTLIEIGDVVTIDAIACCVDDASINSVGGEEMKVDLTVSKEDSMTYTA